MKNPSTYEAKDEGKTCILAWKEKRVLSGEITKWLGRYRSFFDLLVAKTSHLSIPQHGVVDKSLGIS
jgi:uncharacterized protein YutE (UPF0331/DUF86 family)